MSVPQAQPPGGGTGTSRRMRRGTFIRVGLTGVVGVAVGAQSKLLADLLVDTASAATPVYELTITDAVVEMIDLTPVYHRVFASDAGPHLPGPVLHAYEGDDVELRITNALDEEHAFAIHDTAIATGPIAPGATAVLRFTAPRPGTYLYLDPTDAPVNRLLGLHGAMVVMPTTGTTPYTDPPASLQRLFDDLGATAHFPGLPWTPERQRVWVTHTVDPRWHQTAASGVRIDPARLLADYRPRYFTLNGQSGYFASHEPRNQPVGRIGSPYLVRIANAGLAAHSMHCHGNHVYLCALDRAVSDNVFLVDTFTLVPLGTMDWLLPIKRPPDIPGPQNRPLRDALAGELAFVDELGVRQCPLEFPVHCHMEMSQTARGGNYPGGLVTHWTISGDLDLDFKDAGFDCPSTAELTLPNTHLGTSDG